MRPPRSYLTFLLCVALLGGCATAPMQDPPRLEPERQATLAAWLADNGQAPVPYVVSLFSTHDVVFLGEQHRVKHDPLLVQSLLEPLYRSGVRVLAFEFARREDQALIDSFLSAPLWDEKLAREIVFREFVSWGYEEYVGVLKAAWNVNRSLAPGAPPFRILGMNDSPDWSYAKTQADLQDPAIVRLIWGEASERLWAKVILDQVRSGERVLVYSGIHHAFTRYRQPVVADGQLRGFSQELRCGNYVYEALGPRAMTVFLHAPWNGKAGYEAPMRHPADGAIDALMLEIGPHPVGFDLAEGPFGELAAVDAVYVHGYPSFKLSDFCDGWIYTMPISLYEGVTPIRGWINAGNLERARAQFPNPYFRRASAPALNAAISSDAQIRRRWGYLR